MSIKNIINEIETPIISPLYQPVYTSNNNTAYDKYGLKYPKNFTSLHSINFFA